MFRTSCMENREAIYAVLAPPPLRANAITPAGGTAFMVAPGLLVTTARAVCREAGPDGPAPSEVPVIRAPDIGKKAETATVFALDHGKDVALLRIDAPRSDAILKLLGERVPVGTPCGASGFPRIAVDSVPAVGVSLIELFQGGTVSAFVDADGGVEGTASWYETDSPMYGDASGCPGFVASGEVFGMHLRSAVNRPKGGEEGCPGADGPPSGVSVWVSSMELIAFAAAHGVSVDAARIGVDFDGKGRI
jgi:hypothetical protein